MESFAVKALELKNRHGNLFSNKLKSAFSSIFFNKVRMSAISLPDWVILTSRAC